MLADGHQTRHQLGFAAHRFSGPGQVIPDQRIVEKLVRQVGERSLPLRLETAEQLVQMLERRIVLDHAQGVGIEAALGDQRALRPRQGLRRIAREQSQQR
ncbi:MAG: hypothetical protein Q8K85_09465, partial [Hyphomicrobium sp.]|nr:hypothetical protein [Hyphomicrobium sp.]